MIKSRNSESPVVIAGTGVYVPAQGISNQELVETYNAYVDMVNKKFASEIATGMRDALEYSSAEFIESVSGIKHRYVINREGILNSEIMRPIIPDRPDQELSLQAEMAVAAADQALAQAGIAGDSVDVVIAACSNFQRAYPSIAIEVQSALGIEGFGYDMNVACSSATFGIQAAVNTIRAGMANTVLMVNPEICSAHLAWEDRDCHFIFGDVCTAVVLRAVEQPVTGQWSILGTKLWTQFSNNIRNNRGFLNRCDPEHADTRDKLFYQNGRKVFKEVCSKVSQHLEEHAEALGISCSDLKRLWLHQANLNMNNLIASKVLGRTASLQDAPVILDEYANTSSAGSIVAFHLHRDHCQSGDLGVICSFGAGYSVGSVVVECV